MCRTFLRTLIALSIWGGIAAHPQLLSAVEINDEAGFFSQSALDRANMQIADLRQKHGKELRIETFKAVPSDKVATVAKMSREDRQTFFKKWATDRATAEHAKGIFVLICKQPGHVQVEVDRQTRGQGFGTAERDQLRDKLLAGFRGHDYDKALLDSVDYVSRAFRNQPVRAEAEMPAPPSPQAGHPAAGHPGRAGPPREPGGQGLGLLGWAIVAVAVFFGIRLIGMMFGGLMGGGQPAGGGYGPGYGGGGGGGLFGSLMTGMFGAIAGNWIYNSFLGNSAHAAPPSSYGDDAGHDFQGSGGDFNGGDDSGAGDFSGGDSGGGGDFGGDDFGGGDSGGGGDF